MKIKRKIVPWHSLAKWILSKQGILFFAIILVLAAVFFGGVFAQRNGKIRYAKNRLIQTTRFLGWIKYRSHSSPDQLVLDINQTNIQKLAYQRERALANGVHIFESGDWVEARIRVNELSLPIRIRLKGTLSDHWEDNRKWSYAIRLRGGNTYKGMERFTIQDPAARDFIFEWLYMKALRKEGLIASRLAFVEVFINGDNHGIYALEEHYDRLLIENNRLREGPIVGFNKDLSTLLSMDALRNGLGPWDAWVERNDFRDSPIDGSQTDQLETDTEEFQLFEKACALLESFRRGDRSAAQIFDVEQMASFMALRVLFGSVAFDWRNFKFYLNPVTSKLQPIDQEVIPKGLAYDWWLNDPDAHYHNLLIHLLFKDKDFYLKYILNLERMAESSYVSSFLNDVKEELETNLGMLYWGLWEHPNFVFTEEYFHENQEKVRAALRPHKGGHAYFDSIEENRLRLRFGNLQRLPIEIIGVYKEGVCELPAAKETVIAGRQGDIVSYERVDFSLSLDSNCREELTDGLLLKYRIWGLDESSELPVYRWRYFREELIENDPRLQGPNMGEFEFLTVNELKREVVIAPGNWTISKSLVIPAGYVVYAGRGVTLRLSESATLVSYSPLRLIGSEMQPILIQADDTTGHGILVVKASERSHFRHVIFDGLSVPQTSKAGLTASITLYESDVTIEQCLFRENRGGDDFLNLIRSDFLIKDSSFRDIFADALDLDFCSGRISGTSFVGANNDAIDTSGSKVTVEDVVIEGAGDKGISVGEGSRFEGRRITIREAEVALSSKDSSTISAEEVSIENSRVGFAIFQKKPEFGPGRAEIVGLTLQNTIRPYLVEEDSFLSIDGKIVPGTERRVGDMVYGQVYGRASE